MSQHLIVKNQITGLLLTGGEGRRVANQDKGLLEYRDKKLIERQIDWLKPQVQDIQISANRNIIRYESLGFPVFSDGTVSFLGPLQGVRRGLEKCVTEWMFVQPIDMPSLPDNTIELLTKEIKALSISEKSNCYYLRSNSREHYLSMLIAQSKLVELIQFLKSGGKRVRDFHQLIKSTSVDIGIGEAFFANLNHSSDFQ